MVTWCTFVGAVFGVWSCIRVGRVNWFCSCSYSPYGGCFLLRASSLLSRAANISSPSSPPVSTLASSWLVAHPCIPHLYLRNSAPLSIYALRRFFIGGYLVHFCYFTWCLVGFAYSSPLWYRLQFIMSPLFSINSLVYMPSVVRRFFLIGLDALLLPLAVWLSFWLRLAQPFHPNFTAAGGWMFLSVIFVGLPLYAFTGQYQGLTRYVGSFVFYRLACRNALLVFFLVAIGLLFRLPMPPRSSWILLWLLLTGFTGLVRFGLRDVLLNLRTTQHFSNYVSPSGAGEAGAS